MAWRWLRGGRSSSKSEPQQPARVEIAPPVPPQPKPPVPQASSQLLRACTSGDVDDVRRLLDSGSVDIDCVVNKQGGAALHCAAYFGQVDVARLLIERGADVHKEAMNGDTPLHWAAIWVRPVIADMLLCAGADGLATDKVGAKPMHCALLHILRVGCNKDALETLRVLVAHNATWDESCDARVAHEDRVARDMWKQVHRDDRPRWTLQAPAVRLCVVTWEEDRANGREFTNIPIEEVTRGVDRLRSYLRSKAASNEVLYRRKICVVGPSEWGKTSLTKSLTMDKPILEEKRLRTIGIDQFKMSFVHETHARKKIIQNHEVTFWDYAGQGAYEAMHSVFFSRRTLFFVCVDIHVFKTAMAQADMMADNDSDVKRLMYQFLDRSVLRWVRMILARQPDAEFQFLGTKCDLLNECDEILEVVEVATAMLQMVMVIVRELKDQVENERHRDSGNETPVTYLGDPRLDSKPKPSVDIIWTSCTRQEDVEEAKIAVQAAILKSAYSYEMLEPDLRALDRIVEMRTAATQNTADLRIQATFVDAERLIQKLQPANDRRRTNDYRVTIQRLHDLGDILWFDDIGDPELAKTVILDPTLLIDFIRQVFDHNYTGETMPHAKLTCLPFWKDLRNEQRMLSMKRLMQHFHLVYPATGEEMQSGSDLIVPAYWKSAISAIWVFGGDVLRLGKGFDETDEAVRVHWEIHFTNYLPDALFDHLVVASYSPFEDRQIGPDWILYKLKDSAGCCRVVTGRDSDTHHQTLHLEAVVAKTATAAAQEELWGTFLWLCVSLDLVLSRNRGVSISSFARDGTSRNPSLLSLMRPTPKLLTWMPPDPTRTECLRLLTRARHAS